MSPVNMSIVVYSIAMIEVALPRVSSFEAFEGLHLCTAIVPEPHSCLL
jgi:hypothetical protein